MTSAGDVLRGARIRNGLDQRTLARRAGTSQVQVSRIERGETSPTTETLRRLLAAMGEQLVLGSESLSGNARTAELRRDYEERTPEDRLAEAARLSRALTGMAARRRS